MSSDSNTRWQGQAGSLAGLLRAWRERASLTQEELAERSGVSVRTVRRIEGDGYWPHRASVRLLAGALNLTDQERERFAVAAGRTATGNPASSGPASTGPLPRQLPRDATWFTGRKAELESVLASAANPAPGSALVISAIDGMAGIGKTTLAVRAAHRLAGRFPDGQLFIDLHGFTRGQAPVEPAQALERLLRDVGIPGDHIPVRLEERTALWRSVLAGRQMLILLDNADTEAQVEPLLPGAADCLVLVTSRRRLTALEAGNTVSLDTLPQADAVLLFVRTVDRPELTTDAPRSVAQVVELCGRLPLAIRIAAARLKHRPVWTVADLAQRLVGLNARLAALEDGQRSVHTALHLSYEHLTVEAQRLYRLMGLHPGPDSDLHAAAALMATTPEKARRLLDGLIDDHLLQEPAPGRYRFHDLVRAHAADTAAREETQAQQREALTRLFDFYRNTASAAMGLAPPAERQVPQTSIADAPDTADRNRAGRNMAGRWVDTELANLLAAVHHAARHGWPDHAWQLSTILDRHLRTRGRYHDAETLHRQSLHLARHLGNHPAEMNALNGLGYVNRVLGTYEQAGDHYGRALQIAQNIDHRLGTLNALTGLGDLHTLLGRHEQAADHYGRALKIAQTTGDRVGELNALNGLGAVDRKLGRHEQAGDHYERAMRTAREIGDGAGERYALTGLGNVSHILGRYEQAADHYGRALRIAEEIGDRTGELYAQGGLGHAYLMLGRHDEAADRFGRALQIARYIGDRPSELALLTGLGSAHRGLGSQRQAAGCYQRVFDLAREIGDRNWQFEALQGLGRLHQATGHPDHALTQHEQALQHATDLAQAADQARAHDGLARAHLAMGHNDRARLHWQRALGILSNLGTDHTDDVETSVPSIRAHLSALDHQQPSLSQGQ